MRLQRVIEVTKLSKKAIYFYIKEGLISPNKNIDNGYYDFSDEDLRKLNIVSCLRKTGMSIQDIKEVFKYPTLTNFFIHRQINNLKNSINEQINQLNVGYYLVNELPTNATPKNLENYLDLIHNQKLNSSTVVDSYFPCVDSRMIAILIFAAFMDIESSEYHNFLWEKISSELTLQLDNKLIYLKKLIYRLSPNQIEETAIYQYKVCTKIYEADDCEINNLEESLFQNCIELANNEKLQKYWITSYDSILVPTLCFINGKASSLLQEYNPVYAKYHKNTQQIASNVYKRLKDNKKLYNSLLISLKDKFNPQALNYAELIYLFIFKESIYTQLEISDLKQVINEI